MAVLRRRDQGRCLTGTVWLTSEPEKSMKFQRYIDIASKVSSAGRRATIVNNNENTMGTGRNPPGSGSMTASNIKHLPTFARKQASARNNEITRLETTRQQHG